MYSLKLFPIVLALWLMPLQLHANSAKDQVLISVPEFPPWMYQEEGIPKGLVATIFPVLAKLVGIEHYQYVSIDREIARLVDYARSGHGDIVLVPHFLLPSRSDTEFYSVRNCDQFLTTADYVSISLKGKVDLERFSTDRSQYSFLVRPLLPANVRKRIVGGGNFLTGSGSSYSYIKRLLAGRVDIVADDAATLFGAAMKLGVTDRLEIIESHSVMKLAVCINSSFINEQDPDFMQNLAKSVEALAEDVELGKQLEKILGDTSILSFGDRDIAPTHTEF